MKKITWVINITLAISFFWVFFMFVVSCIAANNYFQFYYAGYQNPEQLLSSAIENTVYAVIEAILIVALGASLFLFNYRFDGVSLREKIATRLAESKEKRAQYRVEKAAADKQAAIEDKQKRLEQLQSELDELKKD